MIQKRSVISIIDNSGILKIRIIKVIKHSYKYTGGLGDILVGSVQKGSIKKGNRDQKIYYTLLINIRCWTKRANGFYFKNDFNRGILLSANLSSLSNKIFTYLPLEAMAFSNYNQIKKQTQLFL